MGYLRYLFIIGWVVALFSGCATMEMQTKVKMTKSVFLHPAQTQDKTVYISVKQITEDKLDLMPLLQQNLKTKGYKIVTDPKRAKYVLFVNILFANNLREANAVKSGVAAGVTSGIIAAGSGSSTQNSLLVGAAIALAGGAVSKAMEDEIYRAVVDVVIDERSDESDQNTVMGYGYKEHTTRVMAEAVQTNLKLEEALPVLTQKVARQISNIF